jgi:hypothetical protein
VVGPLAQTVRTRPFTTHVIAFAPLRYNVVVTENDNNIVPPSPKWIASEAFSLALTFGGYASFTYVLGYVYWWSFLDVFGATFLISQVPTVEALFGSVTVLAPIMMVLLTLVVERRTPTDQALHNAAYGSITIAGIIMATDLFVGARFLDAVRAWAFALAGVLTVIGATAWASLSAVAWRTRSRDVFFKRMSVFVACAFVLWPIFAGRYSAFQKLAKHESELPVVTTAASGRTGYLLFVTDDYAFCTERAALGAESSIVVIPWPAITKITGVRELRRH